MLLSDDLPLEVPKHEKDEAKKLGVRPFYANEKFSHWFAPAKKEAILFEKWWPEEFRQRMIEEGIVDDKPKVLESHKNFSLSAVLSSVQATIREGFAAPMWIRAEIVNRSDKGHTYLELSDYDGNGSENAKARGMIWSSDARIVHNFKNNTGLDLKAGMKILFQALVEFNPKFGLSLRIINLDPSFTVGEMELKIAAIRKNLTDRGIFDQNKSLARPLDFHKVLVISPAEAAGLGDFRNHADRLVAHNLCKFRYVTATFSGPDCTRSLVAALEVAAKWAPQIDAIVIIRGGGDKAGLYALNEKEIIEAACQLRCPLLVGIGHDRDNTLLDEIANVRCPTPSLVIGYITNTIVQNAQANKKNMMIINNQVMMALSKAKASADAKLSYIRSLCLNVTAKARSKSDKDLSRCHSESKRVIALARNKNETDMKLVFTHNPLNVLNRGYAIVKTNDGKVISSANQTHHDNIQIVFKDGTVNANFK